MIITSKQNKIIKFAKQLQTKKFVELFGKCFLETEKIIADVKHENIENIFIADNSVQKYNQLIKTIDNKKIFIISADICKYLSQTASGSDIFAIYSLHKNMLNADKNTIVLDSLQDPTNLGAIIRSCLAFDFVNIIAIDSVFPYLYKVIRASMGYVFKINFISMKLHEFIDWKNKSNIKVFVADMHGKNLLNFKKPDKPFAIILGNEGDGVRKDLIKISDAKIAISMKNKVESLNVAVSAAILMHELNK